ncbi:MAG: ribonuclease H-like domain-containing protein [Nitrospira sp.]|nr:ribonuclease H-like domain-containing protein [Nitrospira sp.]MDH4302731.1 ribonuclease H-like domain-containing protein [Nitrospira sp.]MDH5192131.1 ribonuclease H-like domain-containing protein [Nitrospira sp.]
MLTSSFIFLPGVGPVTERRWWQDGVLNWSQFLAHPAIPGLSTARKHWYDEELRTAHSLAEQGQFHQLASRFPRGEHWRLYDMCRSGAGYLDIETTGASPQEGDVTVVGLHHHGQTVSLVRGETLTAERVQAELDHCGLLVTFFGSVFDVPYLRAKFPKLRLPPWHFDLCFAARRLALRGGLKHIEQELGIERSEAIRGLDGWDAVRLWSQWTHGDRVARDQLLAYNRADTEHLVLLADRFFEDLMSQLSPSSAVSSVSSTFHPTDTR